MREIARPRVVLCPHCKATDQDGVARTLSAAGDVLSVTWHAHGCPHLAADRILATVPGADRTKRSYGSWRSG